MRRPSPSTGLSALFVGAGMVASADQDVVFYFDDWETSLEPYSYSISIDGTQSTVATSILNSSALIASDDGSIRLGFQHHHSFTFHNAVLVAAGTTTILAAGYNVDSDKQSRASDLDVPQFPVSDGAETETGPKTGSLSLNSAVLDSLKDYEGVMYFQMGWHDGVGNEYGYSPPWAIATDAAAATVIYNDKKAAGTDMALTATAVFTPMPTPFVDVDPATSSIPSSSGSDSSSTSPASSSISPTSTSSGTGIQANTSHADTHGALARSALIGIIVGCVAALALLLLGAFLCLRKRRQQQSRRNGAHFLQRDTQQDLILADKEAQAVGAGPGTPYSEVYDDAAAGDGPRGAALAEAGPRRGSVAYSSLRNVAAANGGAGGESLTAAVDAHSLSVVSLHEPYADEQQQEQQQQFHRTTSHNTAAAADDLVVSPDSEVDHEQSPLAAAGGSMGSSRVGGAGTPQLGPPTRVLRADTPGGKSISDYLHEDGMTEDQIRRLEEEERALDEAIERAERAAGGRAGAPGT